jgi:hypothetical protein
LKVSACASGAEARLRAMDRARVLLRNAAREVGASIKDIGVSSGF